MVISSPTLRRALSICGLLGTDSVALAREKTEHQQNLERLARYRMSAELRPLAEAILMAEREANSDEEDTVVDTLTDMLEEEPCPPTRRNTPEQQAELALSSLRLSWCTQ